MADEKLRRVDLAETAEAIRSTGREPLMLTNPIEGARAAEIRRAIADPGIRGELARGLLRLLQAVVGLTFLSLFVLIYLVVALQAEVAAMLKDLIVTVITLAFVAVVGPAAAAIGFFFGQSSRD
jgi:hypothetical protein